MSIESSTRSPADVRAELTLLSELGYTRFAAVQQETIPLSSIETVRRDGLAMHHTFEPHSSGAFGTDIGGWLARREAESRYAASSS